MNGAGTALHEAAEGGHSDVVRWLIENGAEVQRPVMNGAGTALHEAARGRP